MSQPSVRRSGAPRRLVVDGLVATSVATDDRDGRVADLLERAGPAGDADHATVHSGDGHYRASIPVEALARAELRDGRLWVPDPPTHCWNVKDVVRIELTAGHQPDTVPSY